MPLPGLTNAVRCRLVVEGSLIEVYVGDVIALSFRICGRARHELGFYADDGAVRVDSIEVRSQAAR